MGKGKGVAAFSKLVLDSTPQEISTKQCSEVLLKAHNFDIIGFGFQLMRHTNVKIGSKQGSFANRQ